ncbi:MAG: hypothetical protein QOG43_2186 [Actinomycetota bacterium]|nr:hypothetical protein [Actinomycetota bacterium]
MAHRPRGSCHSRLSTGSGTHDGRDREDARGHNEHPRDGAGRVVELGEGCGDPCERRGEGRYAECHKPQDRPPDDSKNHEHHRPILPDPSAGYPAGACATRHAAQVSKKQRQDARTAWTLAHPVLGALVIGLVWGLAMGAFGGLRSGDWLLSLAVSCFFGVVGFGPLFVYLTRRGARRSR